MTLNGVLPAPLLRFREGGDVEIRVHNGLEEDTSIHWHGILVNGVPPGGNWTALFRPGERVLLRFINASAGTFFDVRSTATSCTTWKPACSAW